MCCSMWKRQHCQWWLVLVVALLCGLQLRPACAAPAKWTVFIYMLADNDLEQFGLMDLEEVMAGMGSEPAGCTTTACGGSCPAGTVFTYSAACPSGQGTVSRCCPGDTYPDVMLLVDRGTGQSTQYLQNWTTATHSDYSLLSSEWTTAKQLIAMPGGQWNQLKDWGEIDMSKPDILSAFLIDGLTRYPPSPNRKYMLVLWDHGSGWSGYGVDHTCSTTATYSQSWGCDIFNMQAVAKGLANGLKDPSTGAPVRLDIIGFDACLMAMYEVGSLLAPYSNYLIASELLEPGHGFDYAAPLRGMIQLKSSTKHSLPSLQATDVGDLIIQGYIDQAAYFQTSGLTMGLLDLNVVAGGLETAMNSMTQYLSTQLQTTPAYSMGVMRKRALLSGVSGADDNVDLGALLTGLRAMAGNSLLPLVNTSATAYTNVVKGYQRDGELADGTGMAIYFPANSYGLDDRYAALMAADAGALSNWVAFLNQLHSAVNIYTSNKDLGPFTFLEKYAVCYLSMSSNTWITHGTLSNYLGLTASLMYGFKTPSGTEFITAGNTEANIIDKSAVGTWSGYLFGLVQDLVDNDNAVDGLALAYADETRLLDSSGNVKQLLLQVKVYYASTCYAPTSEMKKGIIKYVYDTGISSATMQLFVTSSGGTWGEVPPAQGGVIIPYLGSYNLSTASSANTQLADSFGYADCLKWGYSSDIQLAAFKASQAADVLGLDLARDMETQLLVTSMNGDSISLPGYFRPAKKTVAGCQCSQWWAYTNATGSQIWINGTCINPLNNPNGAWCVYEPDSCTDPTAVADATHTWDYCKPTKTLSGCNCHPHWLLNNRHYYGGHVDDGDPRGPWCVVDRATCPGTHRAHQYGASTTIAAIVDGLAETLTGLDFDYTKTITLSGCRCRNPWKYDNVTYYGTCRQGDVDGTPLPGYSADATWCYISEGCNGAGDFQGYRFDVCTPDGSRATVGGSLCQLPTMYEGVPMYNCLNYKHDTGVLTTPWCYTAGGVMADCAPWTCSGSVKADCPATDPSAPGADLTVWAAPSCLEAVCGARQALVNISQCTTDTSADRQLLQQRWQFLNNSSAFGQLLTSGGGPGSLTAYCNAKYGQLCVDLLLDPACPALFRNDNKWYIDDGAPKLCNTGCLTALCELQEHTKSKAQGIASWQTAMTQARGYTLADSPCADTSLESVVRWTLMQDMDDICGWPGPVTLACNRLLSPPQLCAAETILSNPTGNISDGVPLGDMYSASSSCTWTINTPEQMYITLNFTKFHTEQLYDVVTIEDFDGVIGLFSGSDIPPSLSTDTGLMRLRFTSDGSVQDTGFRAVYEASATPQVQLPTCSSGTELVQVVLRSRQYGSELSWLIMKRSSSSTPTSTNIVMTGGLLPSNLKSKVPKAISDAADPEYKDYRSYYSYACLPIGDFDLKLYDSYGDGWGGGRITVTQVVNATAGCQLVTDTVTEGNKTDGISVTANADTNSEACSSLASQDAPPYYAEAGIVIMGEDTLTFNLAKQRKIKESLAMLLDMDAGDVSIYDISTVKQDSLASVQWSGKAGASSSNAPASSSTNSPAVAVSSTPGAAASSIQQVQRRSLLAGNRQNVKSSSIRQMLQQQAAPGSDNDNRPAASSRLRTLRSMAIPVGDLVAAGVFDAGHTQKPAEHVQHGLLAASAADQSSLVEASSTNEGYQQDASAYSGHGEAVTSDADRACSVAENGCPAATEGAGTAALTDVGEQESATRRLQQLITLDESGKWQQAALNPTATQNPTPETEHSQGPAVATSQNHTAAPQSPAPEALNDTSHGTVDSSMPATNDAAVGKPPFNPPPAGSDVIFTASEGIDGQPTEPPIAAANQTASDTFTSSGPGDSFSSNGTASGGSEKADLSSLLTAQTVVDTNLASGQVQTHVLNTNLEPLLQPLEAVTGPMHRGTNTLHTVVLTVGFRAASAPSTIIAAASSNVAARNTFVPTDSKDDRNGEDSIVIMGGTAAPAPGPTAQQIQDSSSDGFIVFDAVQPGRSLLAGDDPSSAVLEDQGVVDSSSVADLGSSRKHRRRHRQKSLAAGADAADDSVRISMIHPEAAQQFVKEGRIHHGTPRPRPKPINRPPQGTPATAEDAPSGERRRMQEVDSVGSFTDKPAPALPHNSRQRLQQQTFVMMGPKKPLRQKQQPVFDPLLVHAVPQQLQSAVTSGAEVGHSSSVQRRGLLATNNSSGLLVVTRISGFRSQALASSAAESLQALITNGTLAATLAAQGWAGVILGVAYVKTGVRAGSLSSYLRKSFIAGIAVGAVFTIASFAAALYIRKRRRQRAALPPQGQFITESSALMAQQQIHDNNSSRSSTPALGVPVAGYPTAPPMQQATVVLAYPAQAGNAPRSSNSSPLPKVADMAPVAPSSPRSQPFVGSEIPEPDSYAQQQQHMSNLGGRVSPAAGFAAQLK